MNRTNNNKQEANLRGRQPFPCLRFHRPHPCRSLPARVRGRHTRRRPPCPRTRRGASSSEMRDPVSHNNISLCFYGTRETIHWHFGRGSCKFIDRGKCSELSKMASAIRPRTFRSIEVAEGCTSWRAYSRAKHHRLIPKALSSNL